MSEAFIPSLPEHLRQVPDNRFEWYAWRQSILAYRTMVRQIMDDDLGFRAQVLELCAQDYAYALCLFGVLLEPRNVRDFYYDDAGVLQTFMRKKGWMPWVPFAFQVNVIREIEAALATDDDDTGKEDIVVEKSRDVGLTWTFCWYAACDWMFADDTIVGMYSHKEELVDSDSPKSMFYKVKASVGVNYKVPKLCHSPNNPILHGVPVRLPDYMQPSGYDPIKHGKHLNLIHPERNNQIQGEATTSKSGISDRTSYNILDEIAKHKEFYTMWSNQSAVTDHRFGLTSPDRRHSDEAFMLVEQARLAQNNPAHPGPRLISIHWSAHPLRDEKWESRMRARHANDIAGFEREYCLNWSAGMGDWVYPYAKRIIPTMAPYRPGIGVLYCAIDPAIGDDTSVGWFQWIPGEEKPYRLVEAITLKTPSADFLARLLMGFPPGHPERREYENDRDMDEVMDFTWSLRRAGTPVMYFGDPYGKHKMGSNSETYYMSLYQTGEMLHAKYRDTNTEIDAAHHIMVPYHEINVIVKMDEKARFHLKRREDLNTQLRLLDVNDTPRCRYVLLAIQNNKYKSKDENRVVMSEPQEPIHDWSSHPTTMCEFWAVNSVIHSLTSTSTVEIGEAGEAVSYAA